MTSQHEQAQKHENMVPPDTNTQEESGWKTLYQVLYADCLIYFLFSFRLSHLICNSYKMSTLT